MSVRAPRFIRIERVRSAMLDQMRDALDPTYSDDHLYGPQALLALAERLGWGDLVTELDRLVDEYRL